MTESRDRHRDAPERKRFKATVDGELAGFLVYRLRRASWP